MEDNNIIFKLKELKEIKPRKEWAVLLKNQIIENNATTVNNKATYAGFLPNVFKAYFSGRLVYSLATLLLIIAGVAGFVGYGVLNVGDSQKSIASLSSVNSSKNSNVEEFKAKSQNLIDVAKNNPQDFALAIKEIKTAAKNLTEAIEKNPKLAGEVAMEVKNNGTLLSLVSETELEEASSLLYKAIDEQMIRDIENTTLTEDKKITFDEAKDLFAQGKYSDALEKILLIGNQ